MFGSRFLAMFDRRPYKHHVQATHSRSNLLPGGTIPTDDPLEGRSLSTVWQDKVFPQKRVAFDEACCATPFATNLSSRQTFRDPERHKGLWEVEAPSPDRSAQTQANSAVEEMDVYLGRSSHDGAGEEPCQLLRASRRLWHAALPDYTLLPRSVPLALTCCTPWLHSASLVSLLGFDMLYSLTTLCFPGQSPWLWHAALPDYTLLPRSVPLALTCCTPWLHSASQVSPLGFDMLHSLTTLCFPGQSPWLWHAALPDYTLLPRSVPLALTCCTPWLHSASQVSPLGFDMLHSRTTLCFPGQSPWLWHAALPDYTLLPRSVPLALTCCTPWLHSASQVSPLGFDMLNSLTTLCFPGQSPWLWHAALSDYTLLP